MEPTDPPRQRPPQTTLPVLPVVITTLMSTDIEQDGYFDALVALARVDPGLAVRILQAAALMGTAQGGDTLAKAMMCIGVRELDQLVTRQSSARVFLPTSNAEKGLWLHSIQVALLSEALAVTLPDLQVSSEQTHLAGLLHDIGRLVYYDRVADSPNEVDATGYDNPDSLLLAETESYGHSHVELGAAVSQRWALPDYIDATIRHHHNPLQQLRLDSENSRKIVETVQFADAVSVFVMRRGDPLSSDFQAMVDDYLRHKSVYLKNTQLDAKTARRIAQDCAQRADEDFTQLKLGPPPEAINDSME